MADRRHELGRAKELEAIEWMLRSRTPRRSLLARNFRTRVGEIDAVLEETDARGRRELVFLEVRARLNPMVSPVESVDWKKRKKLELAARVYLMRYRGPASGLRFDILAWDGACWHHLPNAWVGE